MILLDTSAFIGLARGDPFTTEARAAIASAAESEALWVSSITAWELGLLATRTGRTGPLIGDARQLFGSVVAQARLKILLLTAEAALDAAHLPEPFHRDPSDRMIVALARLANLVIATNDRLILDYAARGHVRAIGI